jgi:hypothetical protein
MRRRDIAAVTLHHVSNGGSLFELAGVFVRLTVTEGVFRL